MDPQLARPGEWVVRALEPADHDAWAHLFRGYAAFYQRTLSDEQLERVWAWIHDERTVIALVAVPADGSGAPAGLAHLRPWIRPLRATDNGYLDDLFVDPARRGSPTT